MKSPARAQALAAIGVALALAVAWALFGTPWRVRWIVARGAPPAPPEIAEEASRELHALGPGARPVLLEILEDRSSPRARKAWVAAVLLREPFFARESVERALSSPHAPTARAAAAALLGGGEGEEAMFGGEGETPRATGHGWDPAPAIPVLVAWIADRGDRDAGLAARLLGRLPPGDSRVKEALLAAVEEATEVASPAATPAAKARKPVVVAAILALAPWCAADASVPERVSKVVARLAKEEGTGLDWDLQAYAVDLFEISRGRGVDEGLMELLARNPNHVVRQKVANALEAFPGTAPSRILVDLTGDETPVVRRAAIRALGGRKDPVLLDLAPYLVEDSLIWARSETLLVLGHLTGVAPDRSHEVVPLLVSCLETPWPGMDPDPVSESAQAGEGARAQVIETCALSLNRITGRSPGFLPEELIDWKKREAVALELLRDPAKRAKAVAEWRETVAPWPEEKRVAPLVKRLEDRDPDNVLRAIRELHRITKEDAGFPAGVLERSGDDTPARNTIREWRKTPAYVECLRVWGERAR